MAFKIYTKTGDKGETSLFGGERVAKDNIRLEAYGTIDKLNSFLGLALSFNKNDKIHNIILELQNVLFDLGSDLATPLEKDKLNVKRISLEETEKLEMVIDDLDSEMPELKSFILPGGTQTASFLHVARTVCRDAERKIVKANLELKLNKDVIVFVNRLSDLLFVLARYANFVENIPDKQWKIDN